MKNSSFTKSMLAVYITSALFAHQVIAEETGEVDGAKSNKIEIIEVTARKKVESIQNVPMSVNAVTGEHIENMGVDDLEDLSNFVPGLEQPKLGIGSRLALRGVSSGDNASFEQSVGTYVDGVYRGRMNQQRAGFFDMGRVEVLKGPQVTLYGNSSVGGAISMITNRPELDSEITGNITAKYGFNYEESQILAGINIPVSDELALRVAGKFRDQNKGAAFNHFVDVQDYVPQGKDDAFRVGAYWEPTSNLSIYLRYEQGNFETIGNNLDPLRHLNTDLTDKTDSPLIAFGMGDDELNIGNGAPFIHTADGFLNETEETMLEVVYDINDDMVFTSVTGVSNFDYAQVFDADMTPLTIIGTNQDESYEQFSQEFRLAVDVNDKLDLLAGIYYQDDDFRNDYYADFNMPLIIGGALQPAVNAGLMPQAFATMLATSVSPFSRHATLDQNTRQTAIFGQVNYALTEQLQLSLGARYVESEKNALQSIALGGSEHVDDPAMGEVKDFTTLFNILKGTAFPPGSIMFPEYAMAYAIVAPGSVPHEFDDLIRKENHSMLQASIRYQMDDNTMLYGNWANGAKTGGFDLLYEGIDTEGVEFEDEEANTFEVGLKKDWDKVRLNVGVFYGQYDNLQVSVFNGSVGFNVGNAASSIQQGADVELTWFATDNLIITANAEYLDFTYDEFADGACSFSEDPEGSIGSCDWSGREIPWVPKFKTVVNAEHLWEISDRFELTNMLSVSYKTEHTTSSDTEELTKQDAYALVDYRATLSSLDNNWHVALTVNNLFDQDYETYTSKIPLNNGALVHALHEGREITLELGYKF